jgi:exodeoxyribonuclease VII small subunit
MEKEVKYEQAMIQLEDIVRKMENDELDIDELTTELKTAQRLIKLCRDKLTKTDDEIKKILADSNK